MEPSVKHTPSKRKWIAFVSGFVCLGLAVQFYACQKALTATDDPLVRVAILKGADDFILYLSGAYTIVDPKTNQELRSGRRITKSRVLTSDGVIHIGQKNFPYKHIRLIAQGDISIKIDRKYHRYRGEIDIIADDKDKMLVINRVDLERYVRGVLYHEVSHRWPIEAIKAQAVATRTYVLYNMNKNKAQSFDVTSTIYSQVYGGKGSERYRTNLAAGRTEEEVLTYNGKLLPAYFHASCGGQTENVNELWEDNLPPLKGVICPYCTESPHYRWSKNYRSQDIQQKLNEGGYKIGLIKSMEILSRTSSGRVKDLKITARDGKTLQISGKRFRDVAGPNLIKSNAYDVEMKGYFFDLHGRGWGHGVGMCQWGVFGMSQERFSYKEILNFYYPGAKITSLKQKADERSNP